MTETTIKEAEITPKQRAQIEKEKSEHAIATIELLYKLNLISQKMRLSGQGFLAGQKPSAHKPLNGAGTGEKEDFSAIMKVDFPSENVPSQFGETAGVLSFLTNKKYPMRGFSVTETVNTLYTFKRMFRLSLERLAQHKIKTVLMFVLFKKLWEGMAVSLLEGFAWGMDKHRLKNDRWCQPVREIRRVFYKLGIEDGLADPEKHDALPTTAGVYAYAERSIACLLEFDDAYRYRFQWLPWDSKAVAKSPVRELRRMFAILIERESDKKLKLQWKAFRQAVLVLAVHRPMRRYIKRFFNELNAEEIRLSVEDRYHAVAKSSFKWDLPPQSEY